MSPQRSDPPVRYRGLDRLRGLGLWLMVAHHLNSWTVGSVLTRERVKGFERYATTDLAPVLFIIALGGAAVIVGSRLRDRRGAGTLGVARRWAMILLAALGLELALHHEFNDVGVLGILALCGVLITAIAAAVGRRPAVWAAIAVGLTLAAEHTVTWATRDGDISWLHVVDPKFPIVTYLALATFGSLAIACMPSSEDPLRLAGLSALATVALAIDAAAGDWPPVRYPGDLRFILPGAAAGLALWAVLAWAPAVRALGPVATWLERAGGRSLVIFIGHYLIWISFDRWGVPESFRSAWFPIVGCLIIYAISARPPRRRPPPPDPSPPARSTGGSGSITV
jgi:hypothetical protein